MFEIVHDHDGKHDDAEPKSQTMDGIPEHPDTREEVTQGLQGWWYGCASEWQKVYGSLRGGYPHYIQYVRTSKYNFEVFLEVTSY